MIQPNIMVASHLPRKVEAYLVDNVKKKTQHVNWMITGTKKTPTKSFQLATTSLPLILTEDFASASFLFISANFIKTNLMGAMYMIPGIACLTQTTIEQAPIT